MAASPHESVAGEPPDAAESEAAGASAAGALSELTHEARNELFAIMLRVHHAREALDDGQADQLRQHLLDIQSSTRTVGTLIERLAELARQ